MLDSVLPSMLLFRLEFCGGKKSFGDFDEGENEVSKQEIVLLYN